MTAAPTERAAGLRPVHLFVSVGTVEQPFARLIDWADRWVRRRRDRGGRVDMVVQHGYSPTSDVGRNHMMLSAEELARQYAEADLVVTQVGPGTIADANTAGLLPVVVPRDPALGEHVDRHQFAFGAFMHARGRCLTATDEGTFDRLLDRLTEQPTRPGKRPPLPTTGPEAGATCAAMAGTVRRMLDRRPARFSLRRAAVMARPLTVRPPAVPAAEPSVGPPADTLPRPVGDDQIQDHTRIPQGPQGTPQ